MSPFVVIPDAFFRFSLPALVEVAAMVITSMLIEPLRALFVLGNAILRQSHELMRNTLFEGWTIIESRVKSLILLIILEEPDEDESMG